MVLKRGGSSSSISRMRPIGFLLYAYLPEHDKNPAGLELYFYLIDIQKVINLSFRCATNYPPTCNLILKEPISI